MKDWGYFPWKERNYTVSRSHAVRICSRAFSPWHLRVLIDRRNSCWCHESSVKITLLTRPGRYTTSYLTTCIYRVKSNVCHRKAFRGPVSAVVEHCKCGTWNCETRKLQLTRMWANAQPDGRPAEHRWRPLFNAAKFGWRPLLDAVQ